MLPTNRKFEDFMDFRDMIQGNSLNDRREMVQYISKKPRIGRALGGQATPASRQSVEKSMGDKRIAKPGDSLAEIFVESALAKNPNLFDKFYKQQSKISDGTEIIKRGLTSLPVVEASFGGFLKDLGIGIAKSVVGDIAGEALGGIAESFNLGGVADALGTSAGKALFGAGTNALFDYGAKEVFGYGQGPSFENFATDALFRGVADYYSTPEDERSFFGELGLDEEEDAKKIKAIQDARKKIRASRLGELEFDTKGPRGGSRREEPAPFMDRVKQYGRYTGPSGNVSLKNLALRASPAAASAIMKASAVPAQPQGIGQQQIQPSRFVPRLSREVGGLRGITVPAKVDRNELNQRQITELSTKGFTIHKGKRITRQDLIGRTEYARRTQPVMAAKGGPITNEEFVMSLMYPRQFSGMVGGDGHGMEDNVQMPIVSDGEQVATLAVSPKEYVVDAYTMSALGNGNADEGAKIMDETIKSIRRNAYGTSKQPNEINGTKALRSGLSSLG
jgi:hypothetical protein